MDEGGAAIFAVPTTCARVGEGGVGGGGEGEGDPRQERTNLGVGDEG